MTEEDARSWIDSRFGEEKTRLLERYGRALLEESARQNLIAASTADRLWTRHLLDSAQLATFRPPTSNQWLDVGAGAGLPGIILAVLLPNDRFTLVEPRRRRVDFLRQMVEHLELANTAIVLDKVERHCAPPFDVITARAVASAAELISATGHLRTATTTYILPRGRGGAVEVESLQERWQGMFHVEQSLTDPSSTIIVASGVA